MARDAQLNGRAARDAARIMELQAEVDDLRGQVDELAFDRDELTEQRDQALAQVAALLEPNVPGQCVKVRHLHRADAHAHARKLAFAQPGDRFHTYDTCHTCPPMPVFDTRPWHVAHCRDDCGDTIWVQEHVLYLACGCRRSRHDELLWACDQHTLRLRQGAA